MILLYRGSFAFVADINGLRSKIKQLESVSNSLVDLVRIIDSATAIASRSQCYGGMTQSLDISLEKFYCHDLYIAGILANESTEILVLKSNITNVTKQIQELLPLIEPTIAAHTSSMNSANSSTISPNTKASHGNQAALSASKGRNMPSPQATSNVLLSASRLLGHTEDLKKCAIAMKPVPAQSVIANNPMNTQTTSLNQQNAGGDTGGGIQQLISQLTQMNTGPTGLEKLAFPMMRVRLQDQYAFEEEFVVYGNDGNKIDCIYIPSKQRKAVVREAQNQQQSSTGASPVRRHSGTAASLNLGVSPVGTVLFCPPNCGFFECLSQMPVSSSWLGFYTNLGFDFVVFNYRGYGQSIGGTN
jgi:hypothetical protein